MAAYIQLTVTKPGIQTRPGENRLRLTFTNRKQANEFDIRCMVKGYKVERDEYALMRTADEADEQLAVWFR